MLRPHEQQKLERIKAQIDAGEYDVPGEEIAGAMLSTQGCPEHPGFEFPAWMDCPKCETVKTEGRRVAFVREWQDFRQKSSMVDDLEPEPTKEDLYVRDRRFIQGVVGVLLLTLLFGLWMAAVNRGMAAKQEQDRIEGRR